MMKPSKEEENVLQHHSARAKLIFTKREFLKTNRYMYKIIFTYFLLVSAIYAQVPLNGFCRFQEFNTLPDYERLFTVDYNSDGYRDLILFSNLENRYIAQTYDGKLKNFRQSGKYFPLRITNIHSLGKYNGNTGGYAFTSRSERTAGIISFSKSGSINVTSKIKLDSYPNYIDASDIDKDGKAEFVTSGSSFKGLSILKNSRKVMLQDSFATSKLFTYSTFIDLDYDSFEDIAAFELFTNSIKLFYNDGTGKFTEQRNINLGTEISEFKADDVDLDGYTDFIFVKNRNLEILYGDSVSTFQKKLSIGTDIIVDKFSVFDFNGDGYNDIAAVNIEEGILSILFARSAETFYPPVIYLKRTGIVDLTAYVDRGGRKLCMLDKSGKIYLINKVFDYNEVTIAAGLKPSLIGSFNLFNNRPHNFYIIDEENQSLNFYLSTGSNVFDKFYSYRLAKNHKRIEVFDQDRFEKIFFCFSPGEQSIEIVNPEFENGSFSRRILYADGPIVDLKLEKSDTENRHTIYILINNRQTLYVQSFEFRDFRYLRSGLDSISSNVESAAFCFGSNKEIFFYTKYGNNLYLNKTTLKPGKEESINILSIPLADKRNVSYGILCFDDKDLNEQPALGLINENGNTTLNIFKKGNFNTISINDFFAVSGYVRYYDNKDGNKLFLFDNNSGKLKKIFLHKNYYTYNLSDVFESKTIISYIVAPINNKNDFLIYTDSVDNTIKIKTIQ